MCHKLNDETFKIWLKKDMVLPGIVSTFLRKNK